MKYQTIVADPPWAIAPRLGVGGRRKNATVVPYSFMSLDQICSLPVGDWADVNCALFLWSTRKVFREGDAAKVARAWGFEPCGEVIWGLRNAGTGKGAFGNDHEPVLVAKRGKPRLEHDKYLGVWFFKQVYEWNPVSGVPQKKHSAKPPGFMELVERVSDAPRLEMFARDRREGWDVWGNEAPQGITKPLRACLHVYDIEGCEDCDAYHGRAA